MSVYFYFPLTIQHQNRIYVASHYVCSDHSLLLWRLCICSMSCTYFPQDKNYHKCTLGFHVKCILLLSYFNQTSTWPTDFTNSSSYITSLKCVQ